MEGWLSEEEQPEGGGYNHLSDRFGVTLVPKLYAPEFS